MKLKLLPYINVTIRYPFSKDIKLPIHNSIGYELIFRTEEWMDILLERLLRSKFNQDAFLDVGVNIGQTLIKVKSLSWNQGYIGFEPNPNCLAYVQQLIKENQFPNIRLFPFAISMHTGVLNLDTNSITDSSASVIVNFRAKKGTPITVATAGQPLILELINQKIGILKIDVEGSESDVINSLLPIVVADRPIIICEILPVYNSGYSERLVRQQKIETTLKTIQYKIFRIQVSSAELDEIDEIGVHSSMSWTNYLFCPAEEVAYVRTLVQH